MTDPVTQLLTQIKAPGTFATRLRAPAADLVVSVTGVGPLDFPITARLARKLRSVARPSPFGLREQTLHDPSVRNSWEVAASRVKIGARRWKPALATCLRTLQTELGLPDDCQLEAVFDKLLLYEEGQFFKPHQDSEKTDDMVGTLVVVLPSAYSGGTVTVEHRGEKKVFRRVANQTEDLSLLAFYADCHHAVSPIKSGVRVALTYRLSVVGRTDTARPHVPADIVDQLTAAVGDHFAVPVSKRYSASEPAPPERLVYLLDHEYTQRSLSWTHLKNGDRARVAALRAAGERLDCECFLALAEVHESWMCADDYDGRYGSRRWRGGEDTDRPVDYEVVELEESTIELHDLQDVMGDHLEGIPGWVGDDELYFTKPTSDLDPFESQHEGYQGNYGNTLDRWYHRAAFVMWPRANTFALRAQASPEWATDELLALPRANTTDLDSRVRTLLPRWRQTAQCVEGARFFAKLTKLSTRIDDPALAREWLAPLGLHRLTSRAVRHDFAAAVDKHGAPWATDLIAEWTTNHYRTPAWAPVLADICADLCASPGAASTTLANALLERELKRALGRCMAALAARRPWLDLDDTADEANHLAHALAAAAAMSASQPIEDASNALLEESERVPTSLFVQLLQACVTRSPALAARVLGSPLHRACTARLEAVLDAPPRAEGDWTIAYPLACKCADCKVLSQFLASPNAEHDWPLNEGRRRHIHGMIDSAKLPVRHTTLRRGRPFALQLRKDDSLFSRERDYRSRVKEILSELRAPRSRGPTPDWGAGLA